ncbi:hypothetical protein BGZ96_001248 [Linnemannia gamsii]|uniref:RING-type E3 ubiquitin transferase n=1 Tax=Linnemannia gamsii TaxID=64522 RepID=A0ABQ7K9A4_9FUNG|nr:hypothetical protein BGZ96_001248 [Linnemannia gamsii]
MPDTIPFWILAKRVIDTLAKGIKLILRAILVTSIWLVILPYFTIWIWRLYFWVGDWFAFSANGLGVPNMYIQNATAAVANNATEKLAASVKVAEELGSISRIVQQTIPPEHKWLSTLILDCFEGQVVSAVVVVVFVAIFLLREWVLQNQDIDDQFAEVQERAAERVQQLDQAEIEGALGLLVAAQLQRQQQNAAAAGGVPAAEEHGPLQGRAAGRLDPPAFAPTLGRRNPTNLLQNRDNIWADDFDVFDDETDPFRDIRDIPDLSPRDAFLAPAESSSSANRPGYVYDPLNQTYHPDSRWVQESSSPFNDPDFHRQIESLVSDNGEGSSAPTGASDLFGGDGIIRRKDNRPLYWKAGIPLTLDNVFLKPDGTEMTLDEKINRYDNLTETNQLSFKDAVKLLEWRNGQIETLFDQSLVRQPGMTVEERLEALQRLEDRAHRMVHQREALARQAEEHFQAPPQGADGFHIFRPFPPQEPAAPVPAIRPPVAVVPAPAPAPIVQQNLQDIAAAQEAARVAVANAGVGDIPLDELDDMNVEEWDGILEVIGMRGTYWLLLQNSLLMSALICASLGLGVWVPYMLGKTTVLMNPLNVLRMPLRILSSLTDPITDFVIDRMVPFLVAVVSKPIIAVASRISPYVSPITGSYLGSKTLRPLMEFGQEHIVPVWSAMVGEAEALAPTQAQENVQESVVSILPNATQIPLSAGGKLYQEAVTRWAEVAYGSSFDNKIVPIAVGYAILCAVAAWYMKRPHRAHDHTIGRYARDIIQQLSLIIKIAFFVSMEMVAFPLFCGIVLGLTTLPLLPGATLASRWAFYQQSPNWCIIMHWLAGTTFMFNFSMFVSICRGVVRPGVMWFIRDPNDEGFHPVREILERPVFLQLRKLGTGALMYLTLIVLGVSLTTQSVYWLMNGVLPLRWPVDEPLSDIPIDMLLFHLAVPLTIRWMNPADRFKILFIGWWKKLAETMRLSSFMYGNDGKRYPEEEGHIVYRTWKAWLLRYRPPFPKLETSGDDTVGSGEELDVDAPVIFVPDGGLYRVPSTDRVVHLKNRRVLVPVDTEGRALDPKEDMPAEIDPLMEILPRGREPRQPIDPKEHTVVVYTPPNFKRRLISFIVIMWTSTMFFLAFSIVIPLVLGRFLIAFMTHRSVHDVYSFVVGVYIVGIVWRIQEWLSTNYGALKAEGAARVNVPAHMTTILETGKTIAKTVFFGLAFGVLLPFLLGFTVELFTILPLRTALGEDVKVIFAMTWALGLLYMRIVHQVLVSFPNNRFAIDMNAVFVGADVGGWPVGLAARRLVLPALGIFVAAIGCPFGLAWAVTKSLNLEGAARTNLFRTSYPLMMVVYLIVFGVKEGYVVLSGLSQSQYIRDQEYLIGRQLHNLTEEEENAAAAEATQDQGQQGQQQPQQHQELGAHAEQAEDIDDEPGAPPLVRSARRIYDLSEQSDGEMAAEMLASKAVFFDDDEDEDVTAFRTRGQRFGKMSVSSPSWFVAGGQSSRREDDERDDTYTYGEGPMEGALDEFSNEQGSGSSSSTSQIRRSQRLQAIRDNQDDRY